MSPDNLLLPEELTAEPAAGDGALIGYDRVSTRGQNLDAQIRALTEAGCLRVFAGQLSGKTAARPELEACLGYLRPGDTLVVGDDFTDGRLSPETVSVKDVLGPAVTSRCTAGW